MEEYDGENAAEVKRFVKQAVRLPKEVLETISQHSSHFYTAGAPVRELATSGKNARADTEALHHYVQRLAAEATASRPAEEQSLNPEWIAETVFPTAEALVFRQLLENHPDERRARAFRELTAPFRGKVKDL